MSLEQEQRRICMQFAAAFTPAFSEINSGWAMETQASTPTHGLRHQPTEDTTGWYIWGGDYSDEKDFFSPVHTLHIEAMFPHIAPLLALPPGYRFLIDGGHKDIWFDPQLLKV